MAGAEPIAYGHVAHVGVCLASSGPRDGGGMRLTRRILTSLALLPIGTPLVAQDVSAVCPGAKEGTAALQGVLADADAQMGLPGATVVARWTDDGTGRTEVSTALDGSFTLCELPLGTELWAFGMVGTINGKPVAVTLMDPRGHQDLTISLTGPSAGAGGRLLACIGPRDSELRYEPNELVYCERRWPGLERCPREDLGTLRVADTRTPTRGGSGGGRRFAGGPIEKLVEDARALGANALIDYQANGELISAQAAYIEVDPAGC